MGNFLELFPQWPPYLHLLYLLFWNSYYSDASYNSPLIFYFLSPVFHLLIFLPTFGMISSSISFSCVERRGIRRSDSFVTDQPRPWPVPCVNLQIHFSLWLKSWYSQLLQIPYYSPLPFPPFKTLLLQIQLPLPCPPSCFQNAYSCFSSGAARARAKPHFTPFTKGYLECGDCTYSTILTLALCLCTWWRPT